jgi:hypothetical protein
MLLIFVHRKTQLGFFNFLGPVSDQSEVYTPTGAVDEGHSQSNPQAVKTQRTTEGEPQAEWDTNDIVCAGK